MKREEIIAELEEILDVEENSLNEDTNLVDMDEWDSIARLSVIIFLDEKFQKKITGEELKEIKIVSDILEICQ